MHVIRLDEVRFKRWRGPLIFRGLSHDFADYPHVLLGPNGAGKSTLFRLISGSLRPKTGRVVIEGPDARGSGIVALRRHVGLVSQRSSGLRGLTVRELVAYAGWLKGMSRSEAWTESFAVIDRLRLSRLADTSSVSISGGEARRMMIGMALVSKPELLLFDEPTTGLDPVERSNVLDLIGEIAASRSTIVATHEVDDIEERFTHLSILDEGEIIFSDTVSTFLTHGNGVATTTRARAESAYGAILGRVRREVS